MKCSNCGLEFKQGQIYCPHCGKMQQLVPDYFAPEEEILLSDEERDLIKEQKTGTDPHETNSDTGHPQKKTQKNHTKKNAQNRKTKIIRFLIPAVVVITAAVVFGYLNYQKGLHNSYDVQMSKAQDAYVSGEYEKAASFANRALTLDGNSIETRILLYKISVQTNAADPSYLTQALELDSENETVYQLLIAYYDETDDYEALLSLAENVPDESLLSLFDGYLTAAPVISPEEGSYEHITEVTIASQDTVYYTTDGSVPTTESDLYEDVIRLESGSWIVQAIAVDDAGRCSLVAAVSYVINLSVPAGVVITPSGGSFTEAVSVTLSAEEGCTIYYAWDAASSDQLTNIYSEPIRIPEGNHILSAVAVSADGIMSDISSRSFIYLPEETVNEDTDTAEE